MQVAIQQKKKKKNYIIITEDGKEFIVKTIDEAIKLKEELKNGK